MPDPDPHALLRDFLAKLDATMRPLAPLFEVLDAVVRLVERGRPPADG